MAAFLKAASLKSFAVFVMVAAAGLCLLAPPSFASLYQGSIAFQNHKDSRAAELWRAEAEKGDAKAQYNIGYMRLRGLGVAKDAVLANQWFEKAAEQDVVEAQIHLAWNYWQDIGSKKKYERAIYWVKRAAETAPDKAYEINAPKNLSCAHVLNQIDDGAFFGTPQAAFTGYLPPKFTLIYGLKVPPEGLWLVDGFVAMSPPKQKQEKGKTEPRSPLEDDLNSFSKTNREFVVAMIGDRTLMRQLSANLGGDFIGFTMRAWSKDLSYLENESLIAAAKAGNARAQNTMGILYLGRDTDKALSWFEKSSAQWNRDAYSNIANMLLRKHRSAAEQDRLEAIWQKLAALGDPDAMALLGLANKYGLFGTVDLDRSQRYMRTAAEAGLLYAAYLDGSRYLTHIPKFVDKTAYMNIAKSQAEAGSRATTEFLCDYYLLGPDWSVEAYVKLNNNEGHIFSPEDAPKWCEKAVLLGSSRGALAMASITMNRDIKDVAHMYFWMLIADQLDQSPRPEKKSKWALPMNGDAPISKARRESLRIANKLRAEIRSKMRPEAVKELGEARVQEVEKDACRYLKTHNLARRCWFLTRSDTYLSKPPGSDVLKSESD